MQCKSYSHFFSKTFQHIRVSLDLNFNESLTNDIVSFEQLGPALQSNAHPTAPPRLAQPTMKYVKVIKAHNDAAVFTARHPAANFQIPSANKT